ncbi:MAG: GspL/Epsl periplasmic domain-containing protein [Gemmatimonadota bacterium]
MRSLGIAIARQSLSAFMWEQSPFKAAPLASATVTCGEPFGGVDDFRRLEEEIRRASGGNGLPPAVVSIPPSWTFLRRIQLPVPDLPRAKKMHVAELEGNLPIDDDDILSDLLPPPRGGEPGRHLAVAARRSAVEKAASTILEAGFRLDRVVTDHVALLCAALAAKAPADGMIVSGLDEIVVLRLTGHGVLWARQFPADPAGLPPAIEQEIGALIDEAQGATPPLPVTVMGSVPAALAARLDGAPRVESPGDGGDGALYAYGAALVPFSTAETGGFSLRTSAATEAERQRERRRTVIAAAAGAFALLAAVGAVEMVSWAEGRKVAEVRAQIRKEFTAAVPEVKNVVRETVQMKEKLQSLGRQQKELGADVPGPYAMLAKVSQALPVREPISVRELSFDSGRLRVVGEAGSSRLVETFRASLADAFAAGYRVTVQEAGGTARGGNVRFTILIETDGGRRAS